METIDQTLEIRILKLMDLTENNLKPEGTHRVRTHTIFCCLNPNLWPQNPQTISFLGYPKVIPYSNVEHVGIITHAQSQEYSIYPHLCVCVCQTVCPHDRTKQLKL